MVKSPDFRAFPIYMGWFGKLPSVGDFVGRGLPSSLREIIYGWISSGMMALAQSQPENWRDAYLVSFVWHFVIHPNIWDKPALSGCLAPSVDKVGRCFPLLVLRSFNKCDVGRTLPPASRWLHQINAALRDIIGEHTAVDQVLDVLKRQAPVDAKEKDSMTNILDELGIVDDASTPLEEWFSWPDLAELFTKRADCSFWWAEPAPNLPPRQIIHHGLPDDELFCLLMGGNHRV